MIAIPPRKSRRGVALLIVIFLMAVSASLMLSATDAALSDVSAVTSVTDRDRTTAAAELELWQTLATLDARVMRSAPRGRISAMRRTEGALTLTRSVEKTDTTNVWIVATATMRSGSRFAKHRVGMSVLIPDDPADSVLVPIPDRAWVELF